MSQSFSFNLVDEAWLPCLRSDGEAITLNLVEVLTQAHQLQALAGDSPPQVAALHRFLLAILHRLFGPADYDEWADLWQAEQFDADRIKAYLDRWRPRFDLFDPDRPFYQSSTLYLESRWVSVRRFVHELESAYLLFNHSRREVKKDLTPEEAARALIAAQNFGLCGTSGAFFPKKTPRERKKQAYFVDGIIARGITFLIQGDSLFETLMLNLIQYPDEQIVVHHEGDAPSWEQDDPSSPERLPLLGYLDYLTWQNRRILFRPGIDANNNIIVREMRWEPANRPESSPLDPMQHHFKNKKEGYRLLYFNEGRGLWRDSAALFSLHHTDETVPLNEPPATFHWLKELTSPEVGYLDKHRSYRCLALGMSSVSGINTVNFYRQESMPLPLDYFQDPQLVNGLQDALDRAEEVFKSLNFAVQIVGMYLQVQISDVKTEIKTWRKLNRNDKDAIKDWVAHTGVERHYWAALEIPFQSFIVDLAQDRDPALWSWLERLRSAALASFDRAAQHAGNDGRSFKAVVRGKGYLNYRLDELIPRKEILV